MDMIIEEENQFEYLFNLSIDILCIIDENGIYKQINDAWQNTLGYSKNELLGKKYTGFIYPEDLASSEEAFKSLNTGKVVANFENRVLCKDGSVRWLEWHGTKHGNLIFASARDITERKEFETMLAETLRFNSKIFYASPVGIATYNMSGKCATVNKAFASFFEETEEDILRASIAGLTRKKSISPGNFHDIVLASDNDAALEICFKDNNGKDEWFNCNITSFNSDGTPHKLLILQDITEKKKGELLLIESEKRFREMLSNAKLLSVILDRDLNITYMNGFALTFSGYRIEEIEKRNFADLFIKDDSFKKRLIGITKAGRFPEYAEMEIITKKGEKRITKWSITPLTDDAGNFNGATCIGEDITEFKLFEEILNFRYELIEKNYAKDMNSLIRFTLDTAERLTISKAAFFLFFNENEKTFQFQAASTNASAESEIHPSSGFTITPEMASIWDECVKKKEPLLYNNFEFLDKMNRFPDGHIPVTKMLLFPIVREDNVVAVMGIGNKDADYTKKDVETVSLISDSLWNVIYRKKTTEALQKSEEELRALNVTKDKFFSIIAHDLKSPFQGILGSLQILSSEFDYLSIDESKQLIKSIERLTGNTYKLLENLLQWSRIQSEHMDYNIQILNLKNAFADTIEMLTNLARNKNISISLLIPEDYYAKTDLNVVLTVFRNLLSNAIKFTPAGGKISVSAFKNGQIISVAVKDNGIGMAKEELENLFLIQNQQNKSGTDGETGTGLGLILCKELLERVGGTIRVESELKKGTVFTFTLESAS